MQPRPMKNSKKMDKERKRDLCDLGVEILGQTYWLPGAGLCARGLSCSALPYKCSCPRPAAAALRCAENCCPPGRSGRLGGRRPSRRRAGEKSAGPPGTTAPQWPLWRHCGTRGGCFLPPSQRPLLLFLQNRRQSVRHGGTHEAPSSSSSRPVQPEPSGEGLSESEGSNPAEGGGEFRRKGDLGRKTLGFLLGRPQLCFHSRSAALRSDPSGRPSSRTCGAAARHPHPHTQRDQQPGQRRPAAEPHRRPPPPAPPAEDGPAWRRRDPPSALTSPSAARPSPPPPPLTGHPVAARRHLGRPRPPF